MFFFYLFALFPSHYPHQNPDMPIELFKCHWAWLDNLLIASFSTPAFFIYLHPFVIWFLISLNLFIIGTHKDFIAVSTPLIYLWQPDTILPLFHCSGAYIVSLSQSSTCAAPPSWHIDNRSICEYIRTQLVANNQTQWTTVANSKMSSSLKLYGAWQSLAGEEQRVLFLHSWYSAITCGQSTYARGKREVCLFCWIFFALMFRNSEQSLCALSFKEMSNSFTFDSRFKQLLSHRLLCVHCSCACFVCAYCLVMPAHWLCAWLWAYVR